MQVPSHLNSKEYTMNQPSLNNTPMLTRSNCHHPGLLSLGLLLGTLLGPLASAQATDWEFKLLDHPVAARANDPDHEMITLTGKGTFDPTAGTVSGEGTFKLV